MVTFRVVLDACVLLPQALNDLLLRLAEDELFRPVWTLELLEEVERNLSGPKFGKTSEQAARRVSQMRRAFPLAEAESLGYQELIEAMSNHPKDRHVLAAAVRSGSTVIVTSNTTDFPSTALDPFSIEAVHPDDFLCDQLDLEPGIVLECMGRQTARNQHPPQTTGELLESLHRLTPRFVSAVRAQLVANDERAGQVSTSRIEPVPELSTAQIEALPAAARDAYLYLRSLDLVEQVRFQGHTKLVMAAWGFLEPVCVGGDLQSVWDRVDPVLRLAWAEQWVDDNRTQIDTDGWDAVVVAQEIADPTQRHPLWGHFERVYVRSLRSVLPDPATWGTGMDTRILAPDMEILYVQDASDLPGGVWEPGEERMVFPVVMHLIDGEWFVRNLGSEDRTPPSTP